MRQWNKDTSLYVYLWLSSNGGEIFNGRENSNGIRPLNFIILNYSVEVRSCERNTHHPVVSLEIMKGAFWYISKCICWIHKDVRARNECNMLRWHRANRSCLHSLRKGRTGLVRKCCLDCQDILRSIPAVNVQKRLSIFNVILIWQIWQWLMKVVETM